MRASAYLRYNTVHIGWDDEKIGKEYWYIRRTVFEKLNDPTGWTHVATLRFRLVTREIELIKNIQIMYRAILEWHSRLILWSLWAEMACNNVP